LYETAQDLHNEHDVIERVSLHLNADYKKLPISYKLDFAMHKMASQMVWFFCEVKVRTNPVNRYPTMMLNLDKVMAARDLSRHTGIDSFLIVQWSDKIGTINFGDVFEVGFGGRRDRGDSQDIGLMAHFEVERFKILDI
jgi:hypothetical protein